ncbi:MAG: hypothetical protein EZS28_011976, partial [Streblomastix strix]
RKIANSLKEKLLEQRREELAQEAAEQAAKDNGNNILEKTKDFTIDEPQKNKESFLKKFTSKAANKIDEIGNKYETAGLQNPATVNDKLEKIANVSEKAVSACKGFLSDSAHYYLGFLGYIGKLLSDTVYKSNGEKLREERNKKIVTSIVNNLVLLLVLVVDLVGGLNLIALASACALSKILGQKFGHDVGKVSYYSFLLVLTLLVVLIVILVGPIGTIVLFILYSLLHIIANFKDPLEK